MNNDGRECRVTLERAATADLPAFRRALQQAFSIAAAEAFGWVPEEPIPSDGDVEQSFNAPGSAIYHILADGHKVGGAVVVIDDATLRNSLDLFYISTSEQGHSIGHKAWLAIEERYPQTKVWETHTPYFEKRNIHFYVNKCGFKIVEYYNSRNPDPHESDTAGQPEEGDMFRFEKVMNGLP